MNVIEEEWTPSDAQQRECAAVADALLHNNDLLLALIRLYEHDNPRLDTQTSATAADARRPAPRISSIIRASSFVPDRLRGSVWAALLLSQKDALRSLRVETLARADRLHVDRLLVRPSKDDQLEEQREAEEYERLLQRALTELSESSREELQLDAARTRPTLERFRQRSEVGGGAVDARDEIVRTLAVFCHVEGVAYIQGMNELVGVLMMLPDVSSQRPHMQLRLLRAIVRKFVPWLLLTKQQVRQISNAAAARAHGGAAALNTRRDVLPEALRVCFKQLQVLLLYHDPAIYWRLYKCGLTTSAYAVSWFVTLFARNLTVASTFALWDEIIVGSDNVGLFFFALALLISRREALLSAKEAFLPEELMHIATVSAEDVRALWAWGLKLRQLTPLDYVDCLAQYIRLLGTKRDGEPQQPLSAAAKEHLARLSRKNSSDVMFTSADDMFSNCGQNVTYFALDCRSLREYEAGRLARSAHVSLEGLHSGVASLQEADISALLDLCEPLSAKQGHTCLIRSASAELEDDYILRAATTLTASGIRYVSVLSDGFDTVLLKYPEYVVDFDREQYASACALRQRKAERRTMLEGTVMPETVMSFMDRTDEELSAAVTRAQDTFKRLRGDLFTAFRAGPLGYASNSSLPTRSASAAASRHEQSPAAGSGERTNTRRS